ncbi:phosphoglycerate dehydrogenase SER33 PWA37_001436 [Arxiozyma heterogenica]|uniref:phosphoglycerate dehydrogenase SER33 n=1 Tax=Arxiozyma heterogenica TaxID=278026 RepID=UPI002EFADB76
MGVIYYDIQIVMPIGATKQISTLNSLLRNSDFVTLHVPENSETFNLIGKSHFDLMKAGSYIINTSKGSTLDMDVLIRTLESKKIMGAALDVYPNKPLKDTENISNNHLEKWLNKLSNLPNVILTPHIGGSTEETEKIINEKVSNTLISYINEGNSIGAINFRQIELKSDAHHIKSTERPMDDNTNLVRVLYIHKNKPGVVKTINSILRKYNIEKQCYESTSSIAYLVTDVMTSSYSKIIYIYIYEQLEATSKKILIR